MGQWHATLSIIKNLEIKSNFTVFLSLFGAFLESTLILAKKNVHFKQHHTIDNQQKPVTYSKALVHLS